MPTARSAPGDPPRIGQRRVLALVFLVVLGAGWTALALGQETFRRSAREGLSDEYDEIAQNLLAHGVYGAHRGNPELSTVTRGPTYPLYVAGVYAIFGRGRVGAVRALDLVVHAATATLIAAILFSLAGSGAALATGWLYGLWPTTLYYAARPSSETLLAFFLALALWFLVRWRAAPRWGWMAAAGAALGLACLTRGSAIVLLGLVGLGLAFDAHRAVSRTAIVALLLSWALVMAPWWIRNYRVSGGFVPFHTLLWYNAYHDDMYDAAQAWLRRSGRSGVDWGAIPPESLPPEVPRHPPGMVYPGRLSAKDDLAQEARYRRILMDRLGDRRYWIDKAARNALDFWSAAASPRKTWLLGLTSTLWGLLALGTFAVAWRAGRHRWLLSLAAAFTLATWALYLPFLALFRHSLPTAPFLAVTMGLGWAAWRETRRNPSRHA